MVINRANTRRFIASDPTEIVLIPRVETWIAGTKKMVDQTPRDSQTFKVIWAGDNGILTTGSGITRRFDFILVGNSDAELEINDHWSINGQDYEIQYVYPSNEYEVKGGGVSFGGSPDG